MKKSLTIFLFVLIQFGGIAFILLTGSIFAKNIFLFVIEIIGISTGIWAILSMRLNNIRIFPDLKHDAIFIRQGPYSVIRHPMYMAILLTLASLVADTYSLIRLIVFLVIMTDLILKLNFEEKLLTKAFNEYSEYQKKTWRLLPCIY